MDFSRRDVMKGVLLAAGAGEASAQTQVVKPAALPEFSLPGEANIVEEDHFGVINGLVTAGVDYHHVFALKGLFAPPFASSNFFLDVRLFGERVTTREYIWYPVETRRKGMVRGIAVSSDFVLAADERAGVLAITLHNTTGHRQSVPVQFEITGGLGYVKEWHFDRPNTEKQMTISVSEAQRVTRQNDSGAIVVGADFSGMNWEPWSSHWETRVVLRPGEQITRHAAIVIGDKAVAAETCDRLLEDPAKAIAEGRARFAARANDLFARLPRLEAREPRLVTYYKRSLSHFLLNQWRVPEFLLKPYYSTGSIKGGCVGNYLWNYGGPYELFPLYDPKAAREHILQFLKIDITKHFLFNPMDGAASGPWYPVNQEKIIWSIYYYVLHTGDLAFLGDTVNGKTVLEWVIDNARYRDDFSKPAVLVSYGNGNNHLELRGKYRYDDYMPDLNGRRYLNYMLAYHLTDMAGRKQPQLAERARALKPYLRTELWSPEDRWFYFRFEDGRKELRYTVQMFKLIGSPVLDKEQEQGLIGHLNDDEFLSDYGLHSMSKKDPAYDQVDIDNGGGGNCVAFTPRIAELLYGAGYPDKAEELMRRTLWWGQTTPYWCDSFVANQVEYRKDTPLQNAFDATCGAQCIIFGMFGVRVGRNGDITINPRVPKFSPGIALKGLRIREKEMDVDADDVRTVVRSRGKTFQSKAGTPVIVTY